MSLVLHLNNAALANPFRNRGPNWIHGTKDNPILELARFSNTELHSWNEAEAIFDQNGQRLPDKESAEGTETFWGIVADAYKHSRQHADVISSQESLLDFVHKKAAGKFLHDTPADAQRKRDLVHRIAELWGAYVGGSTKGQSLKYFRLEETIEGPDPFVAGTFQKILADIARQALAGADLKLNHEVNKIRSNTEDSCVEIETVNGYTDHFDEVIVTCPLGYLKQNMGIFTPGLPSNLTASINAVGYGNLDKARSASITHLS